MRLIYTSIFIGGLAVWLYANFAILGLGKQYVPPMYLLAFLMQLIMMFVGYVLGLASGRQGGNKQG